MTPHRNLQARRRTSKVALRLLVAVVSVAAWGGVAESAFALCTPTIVTKGTVSVDGFSAGHPGQLAMGIPGTWSVPSGCPVQTSQFVWALYDPAAGGNGVAISPTPAGLGPASSPSSVVRIDPSWVGKELYFHEIATSNGDSSSAGGSASDVEYPFVEVTTGPYGTDASMPMLAQTAYFHEAELVGKGRIFLEHSKAGQAAGRLRKHSLVVVETELPNVIRSQPGIHPPTRRIG